MQQFDWQFPYASRRMPVMARNLVATSQPLAAQAGVRILEKGGNAVDAALAMAITLTVVEPTSNGLGGDVFAMVWDGQKLHGLNGSGRAPAAWSPEYFQRYQTMPRHGWDAVTVPGQVSAWRALSDRFGLLPFAQLFQSAIHYAEHGFIVSPITALRWAAAAKEYANFTEFSHTFLPAGRAPQAGELFIPPYQAKTLTAIADSGGESFYRGELAKAMVKYAKAEGGALTLADLDRQQIDWIRPLQLAYENVCLHQLPPNGQGLITLIALGILKQLSINSFALDSADSIHLQIEAMKVAFDLGFRHIADPQSMTVASAELLDENFLHQQAAKIDHKRAQFPSSPPLPERGTVYLTAADDSGMMVSLIQSNFYGFGSGIVIPKTGISMQNRGSGFSLDPKHPNCVAGGKRPFHTIIPGFVTEQQKPVMSFGVMGGHMQTQGHVQMIIRIFNHRQNPQTAVDAPRWYLDPDRSVSIEPGIKPSVLDELRQRGHHIVPRPTLVFGGAQAIYCLPRGYLGASDPRKDGLAIGY